MALWRAWWGAMRLLRGAFSRRRTFLWFATVVAGMTVRTESLGVTSIVRALHLKPSVYGALVDSFHSSAVQLERLTSLWTRAVLWLHPAPLRVNGRRVLVGDGLKAPKRGKKMPAVKLLHQQSGCNTKPQFIMGHSLQAVSLLVAAAGSVFAVPLAARIHEGLIFCNADRRSLLDKMLALLGSIALGEPFYFVADAYYAAGKLAAGLLAGGNHLITRVRSNAIAYTVPPPPRRQGRGRPRRYGRKLRLKSLLANPKLMRAAQSPVYGEQQVTIQYRVRDLLWRPTGQLVRFLAVHHPTRGDCLLLCTDLSLEPLEIIRLYGLRFKIEYGFKCAVHLIGSFAYHFWMAEMKPIRRTSGDQHLHRASTEYRAAVERKLHAYHVFVQAGIVAQGRLQYLAAAHPQAVWSAFGSWLRTIRPGLAPSERVVANALRESLPEFLSDTADGDSLAKFIVERQDREKLHQVRSAA
jgi:hypothetical protein